MRTTRWMLGVLAVIALLVGCSDSKSSSTAEGGTTSDGGATTGGDATDDGSATEDTEGPGTPVLTVASSQTCHNVQTDVDGEPSNSTQKVRVETDLPEGTEIELTYTSDREPKTRVGKGSVGADGVAEVFVPLYSVGEQLTLESATADGEPADIAVGGEDSFTVAPLDDPATVCDLSSSAN